MKSRQISLFLNLRRVRIASSGVFSNVPTLSRFSLSGSTRTRLRTADCRAPPEAESPVLCGTTLAWQKRSGVELLHQEKRGVTLTADSPREGAIHK